jgi:UDP-3-O-[3-hydroxymyristoyl] glucosamine N-acyltransferase
MTLQEVRDFVGQGEIVGDGGFVCRSVASLEGAGGDQLSFVKDQRFVERAHRSRAGALLVPVAIDGLAAHQLVVESPYAAFGTLLRKIAREKRAQPAGLHPSAVIDPGATLGRDVTIGAGAVVREDAVVGDGSVLYANTYVGQRSVIGRDCVLHPGVIVLEDVTLGDRVVVHAASVLGSDGYGYLQLEGRHLKIPQVGAVVIGDDVEIGALATIDRATLDRTVIGRGTKIGDLVHVAHNCQIGEDVLLLPTVSISGSVTIGDRAIFAGRSGCSDNITIGEGAIMGGTAVAWKDVPPGAQMWGNPARDKMLEMRIQSSLRSLPQMQRDLRAVQKKIDR